MDITTVIVNYQTPVLLVNAAGSFKEHYPEVPLLIIDNGSDDDSPKIISNLCEVLPNTKPHFLKKNIYHGPAMDLAARELAESEYIFFLDSDTATQKPGFLEEMNGFFKEESVYGVGEILTVNKRGFKSDEGVQILMTPHMLLNRNMYLKLLPFIHHGQPTLKNFTDAKEKGLELRPFPVSDYIYHHWRGTAKKFGYGLGMKGKWNYLMNKIGL